MTLNIILLVNMLSIVMLSVVVQCVTFVIVMLSAVTLNVIMPSVKGTVAQVVEQSTNYAKF